MSMPAPSPSRFSRLGLYLPFGILALFVALWSGIWAFGANRVGEVMDGFIAREAMRGRDWVCPERSITGYPFRLQLNCAKPQVIEKGPNGLTRAATLGGLTIHGRITSPGHYIALLEAPLTMRIDPEREVTLNWQTARASFRGGAAGFSELSVEVIQPVAMVGKGDTPDERVSAKDFSVHLRRSPGDKPGSDFVFRLGDVTHPFIDRFVGSPEPMTLELQATAPGLLLDPTRRIEESLEAWRLARGQARVVLAKATKGQALVDLSGVLGLDAERRLEGNLQGRARGIDQMVSGVTRRMGIQLSGLLGRLGGGQGMPIALVFENGRMRFGPFPLAQLDPLY
ncbi:MAG: DUF2125 domain-containing protein [Beijerinckiaceae bacterium]|nr:DUF2125 domain-containing protein [Beijerinckiaceae bacterium]